MYKLKGLKNSNMANKITEFLSQNSAWVDIVKAARCRGFLRCLGDSSMNFVPVLPYEPGGLVDGEWLRDILEEEFYIRLREDSDYDWCCDLADDLYQLKAGKNALIILEQPTENGYYYCHEVVALPSAVAA